MKNETLKRLHHLQREVSEIEIFGCVGLHLEYPFSIEEFYPTPINSSRFACTGGDGVHYNLLHVNGQVTGKSPVVMTVPFYDVPNLIVGENLIDFLCLGCQVGYDGLHELAYRQEETIAEMGNLDLSQQDPLERQLLDLLIREFNLRPWRNLKEKLDTLQDKYAATLEMSDLMDLPE